MSAFYITQSQADAVINQCDSGQKIAAIKVLRDATNLGLKESKDIIDVVFVVSTAGLSNRASTLEMNIRLADLLESKHDIRVMPDWMDTIQRATTRTHTNRDIPGERHDQVWDALKQIILVLREHQELLNDIKFILEDD